MILSGTKVKIICTPRPETKSMIGSIGVVSSAPDNNGVFEVEFGASKPYLSMFANADMVEIVSTELEQVLIQHNQAIFIAKVREIPFSIMYEKYNCSLLI